MIYDDKNFICEMREAGGGERVATHRNRARWTRCRVRQVGSETQSRVARAGYMCTCTVAMCRVARQFLRELRVSAMGALLAAFAMRVTRKL